MKLSSTHIDRAISQLDAQAIPENHPVIHQFSRLFGDHTFFIDQTGLSIVEPAETDGAGMETGRVVKLARWTDEAHSTLAPHEREFTDVVVVLGKAA